MKYVLLSLLILPLLTSAQTDTIRVRVVHGTACDTILILKQLEALAPHTATMKAHDGSEATYEGALLKEVLGLCCASVAGIEKRTMVRSAVRVSAADGYSALVALTEADTSFRDRPVLLCWKKNGQPLDGHDGPLQLIVPDDNRHARDVRQVNKLEVITP